MANPRRPRPMTPEAVRAALKVRGLRQADLARICGVSTAAVSMVIAGRIYSAKIWATILRLLKPKRRER